MKMFLKYDKKDKIKFLVLKGSILLAIILMGVLSAKITEINLPTTEEKLSFSFGLLGIVFIVIMAILNRIKVLFKFKSVTFVIVGLILYLLKSVIEPLSISLLLISIPLIIDDLLINNYFLYLNMNKYYDVYKFVGGHVAE